MPHSPSPYSFATFSASGTYYVTPEPEPIILSDFDFINEYFPEDEKDELVDIFQLGFDFDKSKLMNIVDEQLPSFMRLSSYRGILLLLDTEFTPQSHGGLLYQLVSESITLLGLPIQCQKITLQTKGKKLKLSHLNAVLKHIVKLAGKYPQCNFSVALTLSWNEINKPVEKEIESSLNTILPNLLYLVASRSKSLPLPVGIRALPTQFKLQDQCNMIVVGAITPGPEEAKLSDPIEKTSNFIFSVGDNDLTSPATITAALVIGTYWQFTKNLPQVKSIIMGHTVCELYHSLLDALERLEDSKIDALIEEDEETTFIPSPLPPPTTQQTSEKNEESELVSQLKKELSLYSKYFKYDLLQKHYDTAEYSQRFDQELYSRYGKIVRKFYHLTRNVNGLAILAEIVQETVVIKKKDYDDFIEKNIVDITKYLLARAYKACVFSKTLYTAKLNKSLSNSPSGETILHYACANGHYEMVKVLLDYGANINLLNKCNRTPLHLACMNGRINPERTRKTVKILLDNRSDINIMDDNGYTAFQYAVQNCSLETVEDFLAFNKNLLQATSQLGTTALHFSACNPDSRVLQKFICDDFFANKINIQNSNKQTPLHYAIDHHGNVQNAQILLNAQAKLNILDANNWTPLDLAISRKNKDMVEFLRSFSAAQTN